MTPEPPHPDAREQATAAWLASDAFTDFMTAVFAAAVHRAVAEQAAQGGDTSA